jgi:hypothetical protein
MFAPRRDRAIFIAAALLAAVAVLPLTLLILPFQARWQAQLFDTRFLRALVVLIQTSASILRGAQQILSI